MTDWASQIKLMKYNTVKLSEINSHPTQVMSAKYWINIKAGKLPFIRNAMDGTYRCSHTSELDKAIYMTEEEACELNTTIGEYRKAKQLVESLIEKYKGENEQPSI